MARRRVDEDLPFWRRKTLEQLTPREWERLCDGCGRCCLHKLEDTETGKVALSRVACKLLDLESCRCGDYANRRNFVPDCIKLTARRVRELKWLPKTCGYHLVAEGKDLHWWHPLVSGDPTTVHKAGISVRGRAIPETEDIDIEDHLVKWRW